MQTKGFKNTVTIKQENRETDTDIKRDTLVMRYRHQNREKEKQRKVEQIKYFFNNIYNVITHAD